MVEWQFPAGQYDVCRFLIEKCHVDRSPVDRWENTPLDDAIKYGNQQIINYLKKMGAQRKCNRAGRWSAIVARLSGQ